MFVLLLTVYLFANSLANRVRRIAPVAVPADASVAVPAAAATVDPAAVVDGLGAREH